MMSQKYTGDGSARPKLPDGRPRAELPEELVEICERQHILDYYPDAQHPAFKDDALMIMGTHLITGGWNWVAHVLDDDPRVIDLWHEDDKGCEIIGGPNAIAALAALKHHLQAWGIQADVRLAPAPLPCGVPRAPIPDNLYQRRAARYVLCHLPAPPAWHEQWEDNGLRLLKMPDGVWWAYYLDDDGQDWPIPWGKSPDGHDLMLTGDTAEECAAFLQEHFEAWGCPTLITLGDEPFEKQLTGAATESSTDIQTGVGALPAQPEPRVAKPNGKRLPEGIPEMIEVDLGGRTARWETARVVGVAAGKLVCQLTGGQRLKTPLSGKDVSWRMPLPGQLEPSGW